MSNFQQFTMNGYTLEVFRSVNGCWSYEVYLPGNPSYSLKGLSTWHPLDLLHLKCIEEFSSKFEQLGHQWP